MSKITKTYDKLPPNGTILNDDLALSRMTDMGLSRQSESHAGAAAAAIVAGGSQSVGAKAMFKSLRTETNTQVEGSADKMSMQTSLDQQLASMQDLKKHSVAILSQEPSLIQQKSTSQQQQ